MSKQYPFRVYEVKEGKLEHFDVIEESIIEGAFSPTWLATRYHKPYQLQRFRMSIRSNPCLTPADAWKEYIKQLESSAADACIRFDELQAERNALEVRRLQALGALHDALNKAERESSIS